MTASVLGARDRALLGRLELDVRRRLDGLLHGTHLGLVPGHGSELGETREYQPGDDVRRIDWNVSARLSAPHIRMTIAERELETWLVVDRSARLDVGTAQREKRDLVLAAAATIGFLTDADGNRVGALLCGRGEQAVIPPRGSRRHMLRLLSEIANTPRGDESGATDLQAALEKVGNLARRRGLVVIISDFWVADGWARPLRRLAQRHEVLVIEITDPIESELPDVGPLAVVDPASGETRIVPTHKRSVREAYARAAAERRAVLQAEFRSAGADHLQLSTDRDWLDDVVRYVARRRELVRR